MLLTVFSYYVMCAFHSEITLYIYLNIKELLAQNRTNIWSLIDCKGTRTQYLLVHKLKINHLDKLTK